MVSCSCWCAGGCRPMVVVRSRSACFPGLLLISDLALLDLETCLTDISIDTFPYLSLPPAFELLSTLWPDSLPSSNLLSYLDWYLSVSILIVSLLLPGSISLRSLIFLPARIDLAACPYLDCSLETMNVMASATNPITEELARTLRSTGAPMDG